MMKYRLPVLLIVLSIIVYACQEDEESLPATPSDQLEAELGNESANDTLILNPSGYSPLTARLVRNYPVAVSLEIMVENKNSSAFESLRKYTSLRRNYDVPILGLYGDHLNKVKLVARDNENKLIDEEIIEIQTKELAQGMPEIIIDVDLGDLKSEGMNLLSYWGVSNPQRPLIFDEEGEIRWYLDYSENPSLSGLRYDNGLERLKNGNFYFGDISTASIYEVNMYGEVVNSWFLNGHDFHHSVFEKENGNFLVTTSKIGDQHDNGEPVIEDWAVEIARSNGMIIREWDLKKSLDQYRTAWGNFFITSPVDWFHGNAIIEGKDASSIIISGRTQGIVKISEYNQPQWILGTHKGWGMNADSVDLNQYLLQPINSASVPISDTAVLNGSSNHPRFEWAWYPHAPEFLPNGDLLVFDNGDNRNYTSNLEYSRAVIYEIDELNMTIEQKWSYGKARGKETYGQYVSDVDYLEDKDNVLFCPGFGTDNNGKLGGRVVEIDYSSKQVVFEALINPPPGAFVSFHRAERLSIYP